MNTYSKWASYVILNDEGSDLMYVEGEKNVSQKVFISANFFQRSYLHGAWVNTSIHLPPCEVERIH